jgi:hypothetical protein
MGQGLGVMNMVMAVVNEEGRVKEKKYKKKANKYFWFHGFRPVPRLGIN